MVLVAIMVPKPRRSVNNGPRYTDERNIYGAVVTTVTHISDKDSHNSTTDNSHYVNFNCSVWLKVNHKMVPFGRRRRKTAEKNTAMEKLTKEKLEELEWRKNANTKIISLFI